MKNIKVSAELQEKLKVYSELSGKEVDEFASELLEEALENHINIRHGDVIARIPNPQVNLITEEKAQEFLSILEDTANKLCKLNSGIQFPLFPFVEYFEQRFFGDSQEERQRFSNNLVFDSTQGYDAKS